VMNLGTTTIECPLCGCPVVVDIEGKANLHLVGSPLSISITPKLPIVCECCGYFEEE